MWPAPHDLDHVVTHLNAVDWLLLAVLAWSVLTAFLRGILREILSIVGLAAGILLASQKYLVLSSKLGSLIATPALRELAAFLLIALGVMLLAGLLGRVLQRAASAVGLSFVDRIAGALFGAARGWLLGVLLVTSFSAFLPSMRPLRDSLLAHYFLAGAHGVSFVVPHHLQQQITDGISRLRA